MKYDYGLKPLKFWCQKVLPLVYDESLSYEELLCKVVAYLNSCIEAINGLPEYIQSLLTDEQLKEILNEILYELRGQIVAEDEGTKTTASKDRKQGDMVWLNNKLILLTRDILAGTEYIEDTDEVGVTGNFIYTSIDKQMTISYDSDDMKLTVNGYVDDSTSEDNLLKEIDVVSGETPYTLTIFDESAHNEIGTLSDLTTRVKSSIVEALNSANDDRINGDNAINEKIGSLEDLTTRVKSSIVDALNGANDDRINGDSAINTKIGSLDDLTTRVTSSIVDAINGVNTDRINGDGELSNRLTIFDNRRIIIIGDSYLYGLNIETEPMSRITAFGDYLKTYLGIADGDFFKIDIDGGGFVTNGTQAKNWLYNLQAQSDTITNHATITDIVVFGGQNDKNKTGVATAITSFVSYCKTEYPNARIHIGMCGVDYVNLQTQFYSLDTIKTYCENANINGATYINGSEFVLRNTSLLQSDHCHPNENGQKALARFLVNYLAGNMNNGGISTYEKLTPTFTPKSGVSGNLVFNTLKSEGHLDISAFFSSGFTLTSQSGVNWDGTHEIELGEISDGHLWGFSFDGSNAMNYTEMDAPASFMINNTVYGGHMNLCVRAKHVFIYPLIFTNSGNYMSGSITVIVPPQVMRNSVSCLLV